MKICQCCGCTGCGKMYCNRCKELLERGLTVILEVKDKHTKQDHLVIPTGYMVVLDPGLYKQLEQGVYAVRQSDLLAFMGPLYKIKINASNRPPDNSILESRTTTSVRRHVHLHSERRPVMAHASSKGIRRHGKDVHSRTHG